MTTLLAFINLSKFTLGGTFFLAVGGTVTDFHVHIGQWFDTYFDAEKVFSKLNERGFDELWFSSTTSCRYCRESLNVRGNEELQKTLPAARELYDFIKDEISGALETAQKISIKAHPLYWVIPEIHFSGTVTIEQAMKDLPYEGFKIQPRANVWNLDDEKTIALADEVFSYADEHALLILIHCGSDDFELPAKFEAFIKKYPRATVQLAHCRPLEDTLYMLKNYPNTVCDTAFVDEATQEEIRKAGFGERMRFGTDFPIANYSDKKPETNPTVDDLVGGNFLNRNEPDNSFYNAKSNKKIVHKLTLNEIEKHSEQKNKKTGNSITQSEIDFLLSGGKVGKNPFENEDKKSASKDASPTKKIIHDFNQQEKNL